MRTNVVYLFWIYLILFSVCAKGDDAVVCNPPWQPLHRSCVQFIKTKPFKSWQEARDFCSENNADLLSINDKTKKDSIGSLLREHVKSADLLYWWIGLKLSVNGTWYWVDKEELNRNLIDWSTSAGKTVAADGSILTNRCGVLDFSGNLRDEGCEQTKPFICEQIKITPPSTSTSTSSSTTTTPTTTPSSTSTTSTTEKGPISPPTPDYKTPLLTNSTVTKPTSTAKPTSQITEATTENPVLSTTQTTETNTEKHNVDKSTENQNNCDASNKPTTTPSTSTTSTTEKGPVAITPPTPDYKTPLLTSSTITRPAPFPTDLPHRSRASCTNQQQKEQARAMLLEYQTQYVKGQLEMQKLEKELLEVKLRVLRAVEDKIQKRYGSRPETSAGSIIDNKLKAVSQHL